MICFWRSGTNVSTNTFFCNKKPITPKKARQQYGTSLTDGENNLVVIDLKIAFQISITFVLVRM
jgi:hypothetical protein